MKGCEDYTEMEPDNMGCHPLVHFTPTLQELTFLSEFTAPHFSASQPSRIGVSRLSPRTKRPWQRLLWCLVSPLAISALRAAQSAWPTPWAAIYLERKGP